MCATSTVSARRGCVEEVQKVEFAGYVFVINLLYRLLECPIGLRPPSIRIIIDCTHLVSSRIVIRIVAC